MVAEKMNEDEMDMEENKYFEDEMDMEESKYFEERWAEPLKAVPLTDEEIEDLVRKGIFDEEYVKKFIRKF